MQKKHMSVVFKSIFGLLGLSSIVLEIVTLTNRGIFNPGNFFSFFTIESNLFAGVVLLLSAVATYRGLASQKLNMLRGASTLYMVVTGIVFAVLLSGIKNMVFTAVPWDNLVLHYIMPVVLFVDWYFDKPSERISFKQGLMWLCFPVAYLVYSLVRGAVVHWYPYPFLNADSHGYSRVGAVSLGVAVFVIFLMYILTLLSKPKASLKK
jgi:hypothetical protein